MILPIVAYGDPVLRKKGEEVSPDHPELSTLIANMWETMYNAHGVGLAAPQVGASLRLFIVDTAGFAEEGEDDYELLKNCKKVSINATLLHTDGDRLSPGGPRSDARRPRRTLRDSSRNLTV